MAGRVQLLDVVLDQLGNPVTGASIEVRNVKTLAYASVWDARTGGTLIPQPLVATDGSLQGWVEEGPYRFVVTGPTGVLLTQRNIELVRARTNKRYFLSDVEFGAPLDGAASDITAWQAALTAIGQEGAGTLEIDDGAVTVIDGVIANAIAQSDIEICGGQGHEIKLKADGSGNSYKALNFLPALPTAVTPGLAVNPVAYGDQVQVAGTAIGKYAVGDYIVLFNTNPLSISWGATHSTIVTAVAGGGANLTLLDNLAHEWIAADTTVFYNVNPIKKINLHDLNIDGLLAGALGVGPYGTTFASLGSSTTGQIVADCDINNIHAVDCLGSVIKVDGAYDCRIQWIHPYRCGLRYPAPPADQIGPSYNDIAINAMTRGYFGEIFSLDSQGFGPAISHGCRVNRGYIESINAKTRGFKTVVQPADEGGPIRIVGSGSTGWLAFGCPRTKIFGLTVKRGGRLWVANGYHPNVAFGQHMEDTVIYGFDSSESLNVPPWLIGTAYDQRPGASHNTNIIDGIDFTDDLTEGMLVSSLAMGIPLNTTIVDVIDQHSIQLSAAATHSYMAQVVRTGTVSSGTPTVVTGTDTTGVTVGTPIESINVPDIAHGTTVLSVDSPTQLTMSAAATTFGTGDIRIGATIGFGTSQNITVHGDTPFNAPQINMQGTNNRFISTRGENVVDTAVPIYTATGIEDMIRCTRVGAQTIQIQSPTGRLGRRIDIRAVGTGNKQIIPGTGNIIAGGVTDTSLTLTLPGQSATLMSNATDHEVI